MSRARMIKTEFWSSQTINTLSIGARLLFIGIWNFCDDYGVCLNSQRQLLGQIFPHDQSVSEADINNWKEELIDNKLLIPVEHKNQGMLIVRNWKEHQKVPHPSKKYWIEPADIEGKIEEYMKSSRDSHETLMKVSRYPRDSNTKYQIEIPNTKYQKESIAQKKTKKMKMPKINLGVTHSFDFDVVWDVYPKKLGKTYAEKAFRKTVKTKEDFKNIQIALRNYLESIDLEEMDYQFVKHGSTWFNNWMDYVNYVPKAKNKYKNTNIGKTVDAIQQIIDEERSNNEQSRI